MQTKVSDTALDDTISEDELARTLQMSRAALADLAKTIQHDPNSTIEPARKSADSLGRHALEGLGNIAHTEGIVGGLTMGATIGEGGMGIVRAATQRSLGRKVAVKTLRTGVEGEQAVLRLLREAWVTGALEHPNIVPVYDLGLGEDGKPIIVLKHIEGSPWDNLLRDAALVKERFGVDDLLEHNLRILVQVCNAVSLAHARGVVHRDLKPENVMVGGFGEVYLVDWGIAVSLRDDPTGRLPLASQATEMAGTPSYMAPEMLGGMGKIDQRTDVYLLGAILFEILTGRPPHVGSNFQQIVGSILLSRFTYPDDVPSELAAIATRAMSRMQADRFASAEEVKSRIEWYLRHRGSLALSTEAGVRVTEMRAVLDAARHDDQARDRLHHLFAEARFGFRQAIRASGDNDQATKGLREATEMVVSFELESGTPEAASLALAELDPPPPDLAKRVAAAMKARDAEKKRVAELEKLSAAHDLQTGRRTRFTASLIFGTLFTVFPLVAEQLVQREVANWMIYAVTSFFSFVSLGIGVWGRESLSKTAVNRRTMATVMLVFVSTLALQVAAPLIGVTRAQLWVLHFYCWFVIMCAFAVLVDWRMWPSLALYLLCFFYSVANPHHVFRAITAANLGLLINLTAAWSRRGDTQYVVDRMKVRRANAAARRRRGR